MTDLQKRIVRQVKRLEYGEDVARDAVRLVRGWDLAALRQKLADARTKHKQGQLSRRRLAAVEREVAETLARLIEAVILPVDDLDKGHELTDAVRDKRACCQGLTLLYFVLGNAIGLPVRGLDVTTVASGPRPGVRHDACLVRMANGLTIMVDVTRGLGPGVLVSKAFRFHDAYLPCGSYWEIKDQSNPLGLHRVVQPLDASGLLAQLYLHRVHDCIAKGQAREGRFRLQRGRPTESERCRSLPSACCCLPENGRR